MTYAALVALVVYWCVAGSHFSWERAWPAADPLIGKGWKAVLDAVPFALWWLIIIEGVALAAEETHQPHRCIPRGLAWAMLTVIGMVVVTLGVTAGAVPFATVTDSYPLAKVVLDVTGGTPKWLVYGFGGLALFGLIASYHGLLYGTSRQAFALGRGGDLPSWIGRLHPTRRTPVAALAACSLIAAGFVIASVWYKRVIEMAVLVAGLAALVLYILSMVCLLRLRAREPGLFREYRAPLGWLLPVAVALLSAFAIVVYPGMENGEIVLAIGAALYAVGLGYFGYRQSRRPKAGPEEIMRATGTRISVPLSWLDIFAGLALVASLLVTAWIALAAYRPDTLRLSSVEVEVAVCVLVYGVTLGLVTVVAFTHTRAKPGGDA
jgi:ethanolamine permease